MRVSDAVQRELLRLDAPIAYRRRLPAARGGRTNGWTVDVRIEPTLRVLVIALPRPRPRFVRRYAFGEVRWNDPPSGLFPASAQAMVGADIAGLLLLFHLGGLDPRNWTSLRETVAHLLQRPLEAH